MYACPVVQAPECDDARAKVARANEAIPDADGLTELDTNAPI